MNFLQALIYHIYLLQLENFNLSRFLKAATRNPLFAPKSLRQSVTWTKKLSLIVILAGLIALTLSGLISWMLSLLFSSVLVGWVSVVFLLVAFCFLFFIPLAFSTFLVRPLDRIIRQTIISRAQKKLSRLDKLKVVAITGSYGKTTMKQTLATLLSGEKNVVATKKSHNTPVAIARTVLNQLDAETKIFLVEMGAYNRGEIKELCQLVSPDISVLCGINEAHLERFGSLENTIEAKFEIVTAVPQSSHVILNADDKTVLKNYEQYIGNRSVEFYSYLNNSHSDYKLKDKKFHEDGSGWSFRLHRNSEEIGYAKVPHLGEYILGNIIAGCLVGSVFGVSAREILKQAHKVTPAKHRLQPIQHTSSDILVIDDSYNGNPAGAKAAINVLKQFISRRLVYVTPGLVEMGERTEKVHKELARQLAAAVDVVVLVETSVTNLIKAGLEEQEFSGDLYIFSSPQEMQKEISEISQPGDVLLFQNDWPENYQ